MQLLIVEDQRDIACNIADYFASSDWQLDFAMDGDQGLALALANYYDVIVLDLTLPGRDGLSVCDAIRRQADRRVPIIMLTARDTTDDKIAGFEQGADDYLTKPFSLQELECRCRALAGRHLLSKPYELTLGSLSVNRHTRTAWRDDKALTLQQRSFDILLCLMDAYPRVVTRSEIIQKLWGDECTESDALRSHIYQLRQQLDKPFERSMLRTVHGIGFVLDVEAT